MPRDAADRESRARFRTDRPRVCDPVRFDGSGIAMSEHQTVPPHAPDLLIRGVTVIDPAPTGLRLLSNQEIAVTGERIVAIRPVTDVGMPVGSRILDGTGMAALPGFVNCHAHAAMVLFRGAAEDVPITSWFNDYIWPMESNLRPDDIHVGALLAAAEMIQSGVTTVADHYFAMDRIAQAFTEAGLRAHLAWTMFGSNPGQELDMALRFAADWHRRDSGRVTVWLGPHAPYTCPVDFLREVARVAQETGLGIHIHVAETREQVQTSVSEHGCSPVELLARHNVLDVQALLAHVAHPLPSDFSVLTGRQVGIAHCPKTFLKLAAGIAPLIEFQAHGIASCKIGRA
ncbi:MAG: hypothetical protein C4346_06580, partial [Chloroflexota bacterium]